MSAVDRVKKLLNAVADILKILTEVLDDVLRAVKELTSGNVLLGIRALLGIVETVLDQLRQAIGDILDAVTTSKPEEE